MLVLTDTLRGRRVRFAPRGRAVTLYVCGVTPYDTTHLGHARTFLVFDVLVRHLESHGLRVRYAQNVTDIDESILLRAAQRGEHWRALGRREEDRFLRDMRALNWREPDVMPHATREIPGMIALAERLLAKRRAYVIPDGGVYFDVTTFPRYGRLSRLRAGAMRRILAQQDDARLDDPRKRHPLDFALWRGVADGPTWPSPWGDGRPGWHLECSTMSMRHLGHPVDIHGGGADLVYPHHESEIAQSESAHGPPFVRYWLHVGLVNLAGEKMSKSKGNMVFVRDALRSAHPDGLRLYLLATHYRRPLAFDARRCARYDALATRLRDLARLPPRAAEKEVARPGEAFPPGRPSFVPRAALRALDDDVDTPQAIRVLEHLARARDADGAVALARHLGCSLR